MSRMIEEILTEGLGELSLNYTPELFLPYLNLLDKWNKTYNLTGIKTIEEMAKRHIIDSFAILPWLHGQHILDVGLELAYLGYLLHWQDPM